MKEVRGTEGGREGEEKGEKQRERERDYFLLYKYSRNTTSPKQNEYLFSSSVIFFLLHPFPLLPALVLLED